MTEERAKELRRIISKAVKSLDDDDVFKVVNFLPEIEEGKEYKMNEKIKWDGQVYKILQNFTLIEGSGWNPSNAPSLFARVLSSTELNELNQGEEEIIPDWEQPDSTNPYMKGDKVKFEGYIWESLIDNNVWSPTTFITGWKQLDPIE